MENELKNGAATESELFPLDDAAIETIAELDAQERNVNVARNAVLSYFLRQHKLTGNWSLAPNRRELTRTAANPLQVG
jgi:hypothetical protein